MEGTTERIRTPDQWKTIMATIKPSFGGIKLGVNIHNARETIALKGMEGDQLMPWD